MRIRAIILALLVAVGMYGQELAFRHYADYDGLWRNAIRALAQDRYHLRLDDAANGWGGTVPTCAQ